MKRPYLSVVIPAYNEAKRLPLTLIDIDKHLSGSRFSYEILVVNDGSTDETAEVVKKFSEIIPNLKLIDNEENHGKGYVVRQGMLASSGDYRLFTDADNSTSITHFYNMIPYFSAKGGSASGGKDGYDVVIGSRDVKGARLEPPQAWYKSLAGNIGNIIIQILLLPGIWDTQCGFKCFRGEVALKVFSLQKIYGWGFDAEILALAKNLGYKIKEIPVTWVNNPVSKVKFSGYLKSLLEVFKIRFWLWRDSYGIKSKLVDLEKVAVSRKKGK